MKYNYFVICKQISEEGRGIILHFIGLLLLNKYLYLIYSEKQNTTKQERRRNNNDL